MEPNNEKDHLNLEVIQTSDGSHSLFAPELNETYHSRHGAIQESLHVFIESGLRQMLMKNSRVDVFEIGFGTGLNALLTALETTNHNTEIHFTTIETFPLEKHLTDQLNYTANLGDQAKELFPLIHATPWEKEIQINDFFHLTKKNISLGDYTNKEAYDLIYFDAFGPPTQPEMWTKDVFEKMHIMLRPGGVLVTYCAKGQVRRDMESAGFIVERLAGPPGKREMLRATKAGLTKNKPAE